MKKDSDEKRPEPVYYPVTHLVTQDSHNAPSEEHYDVIPSSYDTNTHSYSAPSNSYGAPTYSVQSVPSNSYGPTYGAPGTSSYYPQSSYGQPHPTYGAPSYYPPATAMSSSQPETQKGSHHDWFLAKIIKKFDLVLLSKIILKLIIFKKIIKFIAVICLLMFIPLLKKKFEDHVGDDEEERRITSLDAYGE